MIDKKTGFVELAFDKTIKPTMSLGEIKSMDVGENLSETDMGNGWKWYNVKNVKIVDLYFIISFGFLNERLKELSFAFSNTKYDLSKGWESWNENEEGQKAVTFNNWLKAELGSEKTFGWGEVWADYDEKSGNSSIGIRYKN